MAGGVGGSDWTTVPSVAFQMFAHSPSDSIDFSQLLTN